MEHFGPLELPLIALLHLNADLGALGRQLRPGAVDRPRTGDGNRTLASGLGLEGEDADDACSAHPGRSRRTRGADFDRAWPVVAVNQRYGLPIPTQKISLINVEQRKFGWIVFDLQGNHGDVHSPIQHHG